MSEKENSLQTQKPKICRMALTAFWLALVSILALFFFFYFINPPTEPESYIGLIILYLSFFTFVIGVPLAFVLGIVSVIRIQISRGRLEGKRFGAVGTIISFLLASYFIFVLPRIRCVSPRMVCGSNLSGLGKAMLIYASDYDEKYPTPDKWCDLLIQYGDVTKKQFRCLGNKKERCSYAMNPNCEPNSPGDTVLLFETKGGWDRSGGPELLTTENHNGYGCIILFNDGYVEFVKREQVGELKWGIEKNNPR